MGGVGRERKAGEGGEKRVEGRGGRRGRDKGREDMDAPFQIPEYATGFRLVYL